MCDIFTHPLKEVEELRMKKNIAKEEFEKLIHQLQR